MELDESDIDLGSRTSDQLVDIDRSTKERFELLILSEAGKPIYSYTKREDAVTLMPLCSALIDYAKKTQKETLKSIRTSNGLLIHFNSRSPLIIIVIHENNSYVDAWSLVEQVEAQVISILTAKTLVSVFQERPTFDLKRLLYGSEKLIDATTDLCVFPRKLRWPWVQAFLAVPSPPKQLGMNSTGTKQIVAPSLPSRPHRILIPIVIIPPGVRETVQNILNSVISSSSKTIVFTLLFRTVYNISERGSPEQLSIGSTSDANGEKQGSYKAQIESTDICDYELITICNHHDRHKIKIADIHIVLALLLGSRAQLATVESLWMPVCLPKFNQDAFLHSYIANINSNKHCIVMMSIDRDEFNNCQKSRTLIEEKLENQFKDLNQKNKLTNYRMSPLVNQNLLKTQRKLIHNAMSEEEKTELLQEAKTYGVRQEEFHARQLQFLWYQTNKQVLWWQRSDQSTMSSMIYYVTKKMLQSSLKNLWLKISKDTTFLGWHVPSFQIYAQFDSSITANEATEVIQRITNWVKREEENMSIKDYT